MKKFGNVAIVGFAQAPIVARDEHKTAQEMLYPVIRQALAGCKVDREEIDLQVAGSADYIDGRPFGFVQSLDVMGSYPPKQDSHLEMDASYAAFYAWLRMQAGECTTAIVVGYGKTSEGEPARILNLQLDPYYQAPIGLDTVSTSALQASAYMTRTGTTDRDLAEGAARNRAAGARNPDAQVRDGAGADDLMKTPWAVAPLREGYIPPVGESAVCLVLALEGKAEKMCSKPIWIQGVDQRTEIQTLGARDLTRSPGAELAVKKALEMAGLKSVKDVDVIEMLAATPVEEMILLEAMGLDRNRKGAPEINPSGGALTGHPVMMTGLIRLGEIFRQLGGQVKYGVSGAKRGIAHATQGHCLQHNIFWVLGTDRRWS